MIYNNIDSVETAKRKLTELKISFDRVAKFRVKALANRWGIETENNNEPVHHYFMLNNCDVAYYTPAMNTLYVHSQPRFWSAENLAALS